MTQTEALKLALEALEHINDRFDLESVAQDATTAITAIKEALAKLDKIAALQQKTESHDVDCLCSDCASLDDLDEALAQSEQETDDLTIAYMAGLSRGKDLAQQRKQLTDDEAFRLIEQNYQMEEYAQAALQLIRRTEAAHGIKEKNT